MSEGVRNTEVVGVHQQVVARACWPAAAQPGTPGYSLPLLRTPQAYALDNEHDRAALHGRGVFVQEWGVGSTLVLDADQTGLHLHIRGQGARSYIVLGICAGLVGVVAALGDDATMVFAGSPAERVGLSADLINRHAAMYVGANGVCYGLRGTVEGANSVVIGDNHLISDQIELRATDSHAIVALTTGEVINLPQSILIEPYVWLAQGVTVLKGTTIGQGSIVGTRALVSRDIPALCLSVGVPARVVRQGVSWHRHYPSMAAEYRWRVGADGLEIVDGRLPSSPDATTALTDLQIGTVIRAAYRSILEREVDGQGLAHFLHLIRSEGAQAGTSNMITQLLGSAERESLQQSRDHSEEQ